MIEPVIMPKMLFVSPISFDSKTGGKPTDGELKKTQKHTKAATRIQQTASESVERETFMLEIPDCNE